MNVKDKANDNPVTDNRTPREKCQFILDIQSFNSVEEIWAFFCQEITLRFPVNEPRFIYKVGVLFKSLTVSETKTREKVKKTIGDQVHETIRSVDIEDFQFIETTGSKDFSYKISDRQIIILKDVNKYQIQTEFKLVDNTLLNEDSDWLEELLILTHIFLNRVFLLLKIDNYEAHTIKDDITLAYNQDYLRSFIQNEIQRGKRYPPALFSVVFFDLDNLKEVNEKHGHLVGTEVLKEVAAFLRRAIRKIDILSRFGGDEFVFVLLKADAQTTFNICQRIKSSMEQTRFLKGKKLNLKITGCFGISTFPVNGDTVEALIKKADAAMYDVKRHGKAGIKIYEGD